MLTWLTKKLKTFWIEYHETPWRRFFQSHPQVRWPLVQKIVAETAPFPTDLTSFELVAVFSLLLVRRSHAEAIQTLTSLTTTGWGQRLDDDFFSALAQTCIGLQQQQNWQEAYELLRFGETAARVCQLTEWADRFQAQRQKRQRQQIENILPIAKGDHLKRRYP